MRPSHPPARPLSGAHRAQARRLPIPPPDGIPHQPLFPFPAPTTDRAAPPPIIISPSRQALLLHRHLQQFSRERLLREVVPEGRGDRELDVVVVIGIHVVLVGLVVIERALDPREESPCVGIGQGCVDRDGYGLGRGRRVVVVVGGEEDEGPERVAGAMRARRRRRCRFRRGRRRRGEGADRD